MMAEYITATLRNSYSAFSKYWTVVDKNSGQTVLDREMEPRETEDVQLQAGNTGNWGEIRYKHSEQSTWSNKSFIGEGETVDLV